MDKPYVVLPDGTVKFINSNKDYKEATQEANSYIAENISPMFQSQKSGDGGLNVSFDNK